MDREHRIIGSIVTTALVAAMLGGSTVGAQSAKEGGSVPPVVLELAVADWAGSGLVDAFAAKVDELSGGQMRIDIDWDGGAEDVVPGRVQAGEADLGWVYARGLNAADVHDLDALIAPFLVSDGRLLNEVITGPIGEDMLAGLVDDGLQGLALLPGNQRFFVGIGRSLAAPADFEGARLGVVRTPFIDRFVDALGAESVSLEEDDPAAYELQGVDGIITVADNLGLFPDTFMTSNLVPYTVPVVVLANADVMAELTPEQEAILRAAAVDMRDRMLAEMPEVESSAVRCAVGASVIEATDVDVQAVAAATQPVRDWLAADPATAAFIERIETLKASLPSPSWPATCGPTAPSDTALANIPDGTYRAVGTRQDSLRTGWQSDCDLDAVDEQIVLVISNGATAMDVLVACGNEPLSMGASFALEHHAGDEYIWQERGYDEAYNWYMTQDEGTLTLRYTGSLDCEGCEAARFLFERTFTMDPPLIALARIPDGTYTTQVAKADAMRTGWDDECTLSDQVKTITLLIEGDRWTELQACADEVAWVGSAGTFEYAGDQLIKREPGYPGQTTFAWSFEDDTLSLKVLETDDELSVIQFLFEHEFQRTAS